MARIQVEVTPVKDGWECRVTVSEGGSETAHTVTVSRAYRDRLVGPHVAPEELVEKSFKFLLAREPKESILRSFDLTVIRRYFPEYEEQIRKQL